MLSYIMNPHQIVWREISDSVNKMNLIQLDSRHFRSWGLLKYNYDYGGSFRFKQIILCQTAVLHFIMIPAILLDYYIFTFEAFHCRVLSFVFSEPSKRLTLCIYWVCIICVSVFRFYNISKNSKIERILLRKYYHLMAVSMFLPALIFQVSWD